MNRVILTGRLTKDPIITYTDKQMAIARYSLAVDRGRKNGEEQNADFPNCVAFDKNAEFAEKYLHKGTKILVEGRLQTGSYKHRDGYTVYTTDVIVDRHEFCESKNASATAEPPVDSPKDDGFMKIPDDVDDEALPFN